MLVSIAPGFASDDIQAWVTDVKANNGHVTYSVNVYMPVKNDVLLMKNRRDYICAQNKEAILWGEITSVGTGEKIDYTSLMDKSRLRKYAPINPNSYDIIQQIRPYCN